MTGVPADQQLLGLGKPLLSSLETLRARTALAFLFPASASYPAPAPRARTGLGAYWPGSAHLLGGEGICETWGNEYARKGARLSFKGTVRQDAAVGTQLCFWLLDAEVKPLPQGPGQQHQEYGDMSAGGPQPRLSCPPCGHRRSHGHCWPLLSLGWLVAATLRL